MKKRELEKIGRALLPELPGFGVTGKLLFARPIEHVLRGIYFAGSIDARGFYAEVFVQPLYVPAEHISFYLGWRVRAACSDLWQADASNLIADLGTALKREAVPFLSRIQSPSDVADAGRSLQKSADVPVQQAIAYSLARAGDVGQAAVALDGLVRMLDETIPWALELAERARALRMPNVETPWQIVMAERARALRSQLLADPSGAQTQLDAWEAESIRNLGLENVLSPDRLLIRSPSHDR